MLAGSIGNGSQAGRYLVMMNAFIMFLGGHSGYRAFTDFQIMVFLCQRVVPILPSDDSRWFQLFKELYPKYTKHRRLLEGPHWSSSKGERRSLAQLGFLSRTCDCFSARQQLSKEKVLVPQTPLSWDVFFLGGLNHLLEVLRFRFFYPSAASFLPAVVCQEALAANHRLLP